MIYLLYKLERISFKSIEEFSPVTEDSSISKIQKEVLAVKKRLKELYFEPYIDQSFEAFTNAHHKALIKLLNEVIRKQPEQSLTNDPDSLANFSDFIQKVAAEIEDLLKFLHQYYQQYIDKREYIPQTFREQAFSEARDMLEHLESRLSYLEKPELTTVLFRPFKDFIQIEHKGTFHNLFYCRILYKEILRNTENPGLFDADQIITLMIYMNCNSNPIHLYVTRYISEDSGRDELENLYFWLKRIRQSNIKAGVAYKINNPNLSAMLEKWIEEEIRFYEKAAQLRTENSKNTSSTGLVIKEKIISDLSVAELAFYYRLLIENKFIKVDNQQEFLRKLTTIFRTKNTESISLESLRTKFYNPETGTKNALKTKLIQLLNHINSMN